MNKIFALNGEAEVLREFDTNAIEVDHVPVIQLVVQPQHLVAFTDQASPGAEKFRVLALRLRNFQKRQQLKKLLVTSSIKGEGKSVISANLAVTLVQQGQRILLMDCDMHQSGLRDLLGSHTQPGLSDWWNDSEGIVSFLRRVEGLSLWYLGAGRCSESPMEILQSQRFADMLNQVASWFDFVIIDSPPLVPVADSTFLAGLSDGSLVVVRQARTPKPLLKEALKTENLKPLGIVANEWNDAEHRYYGQYYKTYPPAKEVERSVPISVVKSN
ncbi:MAG: hypothetical protein DMG64_09800 [Acidobacteria bacterium]|nr:MAG: hypothetical protein DMG63_05690 [Acidobacteriota bacterium]PYY02911.1 MAG: hypothetical protein DMG64_09800 [Acidobacteriota bacterium]PYY23875.1 MAG: hypothetical protein DMG62_05315 [Acidobacteriota bacterium]